MNHFYIVLLTAGITYCYLTADAFYLTEDRNIDELDPEIRDILDLDSDDSAGLRKLLLKKLRFREILKENMKPPEEILQSTDEEADAKARHIAAKRHKMEDLMSRFQAYLSHIKDRQLKESMSLPSLRFGRSGANWKEFE